MFYKQKWRVKVTVPWDVTLCGLVERQTAFEMLWHTRKNQISSLGETDESI
jgi:hypothetical protein